MLTKEYYQSQLTMQRHFWSKTGEISILRWRPSKGLGQFHHEEIWASKQAEGLFKISPFSRELPNHSTSIPKFEVQQLLPGHLTLLSPHLLIAGLTAWAGLPQFLATAQPAVRASGGVPVAEMLSHQTALFLHLAGRICERQKPHSCVLWHRWVKP